MEAFLLSILNLRFQQDIQLEESRANWNYRSASTGEKAHLAGSHLAGGWCC